MRKPVRPCLEYRCPELTEGSRCVKHQAEFEAKRRMNPMLTGRRGTTAEWRRARGLALYLQDYRCQRCGLHKQQAELEGVALEVHHVDGNALNQRQSNLLVLCPSCHRAEPARNARIGDSGRLRR